VEASEAFADDLHDSMDV